MLKLNSEQNYIVVIRTAGERTFDLCKKQVLLQVAETDLHIVREYPFEAALRRCYELGIKSGAQWMMTVDADVLLCDNAIAELLSEAIKLPESFFQIEGLVLDKLSGKHRKAGHRMYRIKYLQIALQNIPPNRLEIRPEATTLKKMAALGYPSMEINNVFGIHDYQQFYADIYRKSFVYASKHPDWIAHFVKYWKQGGCDIAEFRVALSGLYDGLVSTSEARIDVRDYISGANTALKNLDLDELKPIADDFSCNDFVVSVLAEGGSFSVGIPNLTRVQKLNYHYKRLGMLRLVVYLCGDFLSRLGNNLKAIVDSTA